MDLFHFLLKDQRMVRTRLEQIRRTTYRATRMRTALLRGVKELLEAHAEFEEGVFYPLLKKHRSMHALLQQSARDHKQIKKLIKMWVPVPPSDDEWEHHYHELDRIVRMLATRERTKLLPRARKLLTPEQLEDMSTRMQEMRSDLDEAKLKIKLSDS